MSFLLGCLGGHNKYKELVLLNSPVAYFRLAELSGTSAIDIGSSSINGTYIGGYTLGQPSLCKDPLDFSVLFNGTSGYVTVGISSNFQYASNFTYECIIKTPSSYPVSKALMSHGYLGPCFRLSASGHLNLVKSYSVDRGQGTTALSTNTIYHVAVTVSSAGVSTFVVNGVSDGNGTTASDYGASTQIFKIGVDTNGAGVVSDFFPSIIDEVAIYNTALSVPTLLSHAQAAGLA